MDYQNTQKPVDSRIIMYRVVKQTGAILLIALAIKFFVVDGVQIKGDQMAPTIINGDRILIFKPSFELPLEPTPGRSVVFRHPVDRDLQGCLRIAAVGGQTITIDSGVCMVVDKNGAPIDRKKRSALVLPPQFSPRDFIAPYRVPSPGDTLILDNCTLRDFFFAVSVIRQESPDSAYEIKPVLVTGDSSFADYPISDFSLYKGQLSAVPDSLRGDWFFWDHLQEYFRYSLNDPQSKLVFGLYRGKRKINRYPVHDRYVFLLADNWAGGLDSRYFGPVPTKLIRGSALCILWSYGRDGGGRSSLKIERFGRLLR